MENEALIDQTVKNALRARYQGPDRHYHGLTHIEAMLTLARENRALLDDFEAVEAAIWFHDAIYDSRAKDNEARSAMLAGEMLAGRTDPERLSRIEGMILATATHEPPDLGDARANSDAALLLDMDLSVLGASPDAFDAYERGVRREYQWVEEPMWRAGRAAVLKSFLARPRIFQTEPFRQRLEAQARKNLENSLQALQGGV